MVGDGLQDELSGRLLWKAVPESDKEADFYMNTDSGGETTSVRWKERNFNDDHPWRFQRYKTRD